MSEGSRGAGICWLPRGTLAGLIFKFLLGRQLFKRTRDRIGRDDRIRGFVAREIATRLKPGCLSVSHALQLVGSQGPKNFHHLIQAALDLPRVVRIDVNFSSVDRFPLPPLLVGPVHWWHDGAVRPCLDALIEERPILQRQEPSLRIIQKLLKLEVRSLPTSRKRRSDIPTLRALESAIYASQYQFTPPLGMMVTTWDACGTRWSQIPLRSRANIGCPLAMPFEAYPLRMSSFELKTAVRTPTPPHVATLCQRCAT